MEGKRKEQSGVAATSSHLSGKAPEINLAPSNDSFFHPATPSRPIAIAATIMIMVVLMVATQYGN